MSEKAWHLIVVGQGAAGLAAAVTAAEHARHNTSRISIALIDKAPEDEAGGNTHWSPSNMRMASPECIEPDLLHDMLTATQFKGDESYGRHRRPQQFDGCAMASLLAWPLGAPALPPLLAWRLGARALLVMSSSDGVPTPMSALGADSANAAAGIKDEAAAQ
jgi:glycine/D-amino acid oxidase-like deaminating enzyme